MAASTIGQIRKDLTGKVFGRLTVLGVTRRLNGHTAWRCRCICGNERTVSGGNLGSGNTRSCGCSHSDRIVHGAARKKRPTSEFSTWQTMLARCSNPNATGYKYWGGRGIVVCERWKHFENFIADMGSRPPGMMLDRIDNEKGYEPSNCKWTSRSEQNRNRRMTVWLTMSGETMCLTDWAVRVGLKKQTLWGRIRNGWTTERALTEPVR